jgi:hypothetical protein
MHRTNLALGPLRVLHRFVKSVAHSRTPQRSEGNLPRPGIGFKGIGWLSQVPASSTICGGLSFPQVCRPEAD